MKRLEREGRGKKTKVTELLGRLQQRPDQKQGTTARLFQRAFQGDRGRQSLKCFAQYGARHYSLAFFQENFILVTKINKQMPYGFLEEGEDKVAQIIKSNWRAS